MTPRQQQAPYVGLASELLVAAELTQKRFSVFFPLKLRSHCDLIVEDHLNHRFYGVQVKSCKATRKPTRYAYRFLPEYELVAFVSPLGKIAWYSRFPKLLKRVTK